VFIGKPWQARNSVESVHQQAKYFSAPEPVHLMIALQRKMIRSALGLSHYFLRKQ